MKNLFIKEPSNKTIALVAGSMLAGVLITCFVFWFFDNYKLQSPVLFQSPIVPRMVSPVVEDKRRVITPEPVSTTTPTPKIKPRANLKGKTAIVASSKYPKFIDHIWERESSRGKNSEDPTALHMYCKSKGMTNEFGFYPKGKWCFDTFEESVARIERWYEEHSNLSYNQKLCLYNGKGVTNSCAYLSYNFKDMN